MTDKHDDINYKAVCGYCITRFSDIVHACEETIRLKNSDEAKQFVSIETEYKNGTFYAWGLLTPEEVEKKKIKAELNELLMLKQEFEPDTIKPTGYHDEPEKIKSFNKKSFLDRIFGRR